MKCFTKFILVLAAAAILLNAAERFDYLVRADFFAGLAGDQSAMDRAMKLCEDTLAKDPAQAEALVWHGSGLVFLAGQAFHKGDLAQGGQLWEQGMKQMADAVRLQPANIGVLVPRGATLLASSAQMPDSEQARSLTEQGVADYQKVYDLQKDRFDTLSGHARSELLFGLASGYHRLGDKDRARSAFERLLAEGKSSGHETEAREWLATGARSSHKMECTGCHAGSAQKQ